MLISLSTISYLLTIIPYTVSDNRVSCGPFIFAWLNNALALITRQYSVIPQGATPMVHLVSVWALMYVVLANGYTGALLSGKVINKVKPPFIDLDTFVECVVNNRCRIVTSALTFAPMHYILSNESPLSDPLNKAILDNPIKLIPNDDAPPLLLQEENGYLVWVTASRYLTTYLKENPGKSCSFYMVNLDYSYNGGLPVRKNSTILRKLNKMANIYRETGLFENIKSKYFSSEMTWDQCGKRTSKEDVRVKFMDIATVFVFYGVGTVIGFITLLFERSKKKNVYEI